MIATLTTVLLLAFADAPADAKPGQKETYRVADVSWLAGEWRSPDRAAVAYEEHWSAPANGNLVGMFRLQRPGGTPLFEFLLIEEGKDGVTLRLRHFGPLMHPAEETPITLKLVEAGPSKLVFENPGGDKPTRILYVLNKPEQMTATVETTREGKPTSFRLPMIRAGQDKKAP